MRKVTFPRITDLPSQLSYILHRRKGRKGREENMGKKKRKRQSKRERKRERVNQLPP